MAQKQCSGKRSGFVKFSNASNAGSTCPAIVNYFPLVYQEYARGYEDSVIANGS
jgi:hypothetical protein